MENKQLYIAYGSNINLEQMAYRCPHSKVVGTSEIKDFELEFRGVATIIPKENASVPVLIWELDERNLPALNKYEEFPRLYRQEQMIFELDGKSYKGISYELRKNRSSESRVLQHNFAGLQRKCSG